VHGGVCLGYEEFRLSGKRPMLIKEPSLHLRPRRIGNLFAQTDELVEIVLVKDADVEVEKLQLCHGNHVENLIADGNAHARRFTRQGENTPRQIVDGEVGIGGYFDDHGWLICWAGVVFGVVEIYCGTKKINLIVLTMIFSS